MKSLAKIISLALLLTYSVFGTASERAEQAWSAIQQQQALILDVRSQAEFQQEHLAGAHNIPHTQVAQHINTLTTDKEQTIVVYCRSGNRSSYALQVLEAMGYKHVINGGGLAEMQASKQP